jgi:hypothetical protein
MSSNDGTNAGSALRNDDDADSFMHLMCPNECGATPGYRRSSGVAAFARRWQRRLFEASVIHAN